MQEMVNEALRRVPNTDGLYQFFQLCMKFTFSTVWFSICFKANDLMEGFVYYLMQGTKILMWYFIF